MFSWTIWFLSGDTGEDLSRNFYFFRKSLSYAPQIHLYFTYIFFEINRLFLSIAKRRQKINLIN